jgi:sporulation protein YlmC with PRC-barrel domain
MEVRLTPMKKASGCEELKGVNIKKKNNDEGRIDPRMIAATSVIGDKVVGIDRKELGKIEEIIMDLSAGTLTYAVMSTWGVLGPGDKFFAVPLSSLTFDMGEKAFYLDIDKQRLKNCPVSINPSSLVNPIGLSVKNSNASGWF